jgi:hypothetical protein
MIVAMQEKATEEQIDAVIERWWKRESMFIGPRERRRRFWPPWDRPPVWT